MNRPRIPMDARGPLGLLGIGLLAGAAGLAVVGTRGGEEAGNDAGVVQLAESGEAGQAPPPESSGMPFDPPPGRPSPIIDPEPAPLPPDEPEDEASSPIPQVTIQGEGGGGVLPARAGTAEVVFIVRLKGAPEVDVITRNFKRDPAAAQAAWVELTGRIPVLAEFELSGASYSGEMRLSRRLAEATPAAIKDVQDRLLAIEGVAYADPDYVAHPGQKDTK
ncbi:hypothetical protein HNE_3411 [Hyphomonas neptunium ATCC 15444]|uniref:Uncharacterized protein n=2 Tax=Hyphomonas TaxID=85 RepID=Q0BWQ9_HYPNA|nr:MULTISPECIES: hypothetical protein [Hyphomonas]ABI76272.1 hypothetical protein HNE_3411 [Hyphomonas neptunium ATCC 15444]KCZ91917.1 hypothetical protein HHI_11829 [Hyphomonas hirschiana VP5]